MECPMWVFPGCLPAGLTRLAGETEAGWPACGVGRSLMVMAGAQGELGELEAFPSKDSYRSCWPTVPAHSSALASTSSHL